MPVRLTEKEDGTVRIEGVVRGDALRIDLPSVSGIDPADPLVSGKITVKRRKRTDADASAVAQNTFTTTPGATGQITEDGATGVAAVWAKLTGADTGAIKPNNPYDIDVECVTAAGDTTTLLLGTIKTVEGVTGDPWV